MVMKNYIKSSTPKMTAAPKMPHIGGGVPGSSSRARINEAAGVKVKSEAGQPKAAGGVPQAGKASDTVVAADAPHVMPAKHAGAKTTRRTGPAGWDT